jgi:hypothetical protein
MPGEAAKNADAILLALHWSRIDDVLKQAGDLSGDVIRFAPGEKHWHGATASSAMTHTAIQEKLKGKTVDWMEQARNPTKDYDPFFVALRGNCYQWCHYIEQTMMVSTPYSATDLQRKLVPCIEITDALLIVPMPDATQLAGLLPREAWDWLHAVTKARRDQASLPFSPPQLPRIR